MQLDSDEQQWQPHRSRSGVESTLISSVCFTHDVDDIRVRFLRWYREGACQCCSSVRRPSRFAQESLLTFFESTFPSEVPNGLLAYRWSIRRLLKHARWVSSTRRVTLHPMPFHLPIRLGSKPSLSCLGRSLLAGEAAPGSLAQRLALGETHVFETRNRPRLAQSLGLGENGHFGKRGASTFAQVNGLGNSDILPSRDLVPVDFSQAGIMCGQVSPERGFCARMTGLCFSDVRRSPKV